MEALANLTESKYEIFDICEYSDCHEFQLKRFKKYLQEIGLKYEDFNLQKNTVYEVMFKDKKLIEFKIIHKRIDSFRGINFRDNSQITDSTDLIAKCSILFVTREKTTDDYYNPSVFHLDAETFQIVKDFYEKLDFDTFSKDKCDHKGLKIILELIKTLDEEVYYVPMFDLFKDHIEVEFKNIHKPKLVRKIYRDEIEEFVKYGKAYLYKFDYLGYMNKTSRVYDGEIKITKPFMAYDYNTILWNKKMYTWYHKDGKEYCYITKDEFEMMLKYGKDNNMLLSI